MKKSQNAAVSGLNASGVMPRGERRSSMGPARGSRAFFLEKMSQNAAVSGLNAAGIMPRGKRRYIKGTAISSRAIVFDQKC